MNKWLEIIQKRVSACHLFSKTCLLCLQLTSEKESLCGACLKLLPWISVGCDKCSLPLLAGMVRCGVCVNTLPLYKRCHALFEYDWPLSNMIHHLKFGGKLYYAKVLGSLMAQDLSVLDKPDCIIPMPLHSLRQTQRGFNQTLELAKIISKQTQWPIEANGCKRLIDTAAQSKLKANNRINNINHNAFIIEPGFKPAKVLVIEDVVTTGATINALTLAMLKAGIGAVEVWSICRTPLHPLLNLL